MSFSALMNADMRVIDVRITADAHGAQVRNDVIKYNNIPCRIVQLSMNEMAIMQRAGVTVTHKLVCDAGLDWSNTDEIIVTENTGKAFRYLVTSWDDMGNAISPVWCQVLCKRLL